MVRPLKPNYEAGEGNQKLWLTIKVWTHFIVWNQKLWLPVKCGPTGKAQSLMLRGKIGEALAATVT